MAKKKEEGRKEAEQKSAETKQESKEQERQIITNAQYVKDISFENPKAPKSLIELKEPPKIDINIDVQGKKLGDNTFESALTISATATNKEEEIFIAEVTYAGVFTFSGLKPEEVEPALLIYCPNLLFPYARRIISDTTRDGGFMPLLINPIDFAQLYARRKANDKEKKNMN